MHLLILVLVDHCITVSIQIYDLTQVFWQRSSCNYCHKSSANWENVDQAGLPPFLKWFPWYYYHNTNKLRKLCLRLSVNLSVKSLCVSILNVSKMVAGLQALKKRE
jgi:hypothetical protein